ncbi:type III restriction-modification system endonuclease [Virgibacillus doumboii]|uniref:type III restriction-modification system endonuclease n=1 Tax=Virgibacillus doumboii TaxID=2697503 RepID=UPI0013E06D2B|nr:type III restriction-modification system endonuclease [Virgibacillus doumboii]
MELILKKNLIHQVKPIKKLSSVFQNVDISRPIRNIENPIIDINDEYLYQNISNLQNPLPSSMRGISRNEDMLHLDIKMETGTGKTYVYTRTIYELHKLYGFRKFIIAVPSLAIKAGVERFIKNQSVAKHFRNNCGYKGEISLEVVEGVKRKKNKKNYIPNSITNFVNKTSSHQNVIEVLLVNMQHLKDNKSGVLVRNDYDSSVGGYNRPIDGIAATRPIMIIDEPHRFSREQTTYNFIEKRVRPQMIVRYGATFPEKQVGRGKNKMKVKDYQNLIYDLNIHKSFKDNLIKGVAKEHVASPNNKKEVFKIINMVKGDYVRFQKTSVNESGKTVKETKDLKLTDSLNRLSNSFRGITIDGIMATKVLLSNGEEKYTGDVFYSDVLATSYVRQSIQLALKRHFESERDNFKRKFKIKTLALFFIDDIYSYRNDKKTGKEPYLHIAFEEELKKQLEHEIAACSANEEEYKQYLQETLRNIKASHMGYFSQDNTSTEAEVEQQVNTILFDKEELLSLTDEDGNYNTKRFIFSKWTLKEGWDNPNIFTIAKLRSSGSDNSKLQEIGRGLRLPVDQSGNRVENESFMLNYIVDFTEEDFIKKLEKEIYGETSFDKKELSKEQVEKLATDKDMTQEQVVVELLTKGYIDINRQVKQDKLTEFLNEYPEVFNKLDDDKVTDRNRDKDRKVKIRQENYWKVKELWEKLNEKYYLYFDQVEDEVLVNIISEVITDKLIDRTARSTTRDILEMVQEEFVFTQVTDSVDTFYDTIPYGKFLKRLAQSTNVAIPLVHRGISKASQEKTLEDSFFTFDTVRNLTFYFKERLYDELLKVYSYKKLSNTRVHPTQLTEADGNPREHVKTSAYLGTKHTKGTPMKAYLYDTILYDSDIEDKNIKAQHDSIEVFGKIPKRSIQIPFIDGSTYSPDFMYVVKDNEGNPTIKAVIESKGVDSERTLRGSESDKIETPYQIFELFKQQGFEVKYYKQTNNDNIRDIINDMLSNNSENN